MYFVDPETRIIIKDRRSRYALTLKNTGSTKHRGHGDRLSAENIIYQHRQDYYRTIQESTRLGESSPFIDFMLRMIADAVNEGINARINAGIKQTALDRAILDLIAADPYISVARMATQLDKSASTVERHLQKLKKGGIIARTGARKTGRWQILNTNGRQDDQQNL